MEGEEKKANHKKEAEEEKEEIAPIEPSSGHLYFISHHVALRGCMTRQLEASS